MSTHDAARRFAVLARLAWRESRTARRRLLLYMSSISLGVAALVAIDSFSGNVTRSVREQSRSLLGGDLSISARRPFAPAVDSLLDSLARAGTPVARVTSFASMAVVPRTSGTRLVQVRAVTDAYPFYGKVTTEPAAAWTSLRSGANAVVDPSLLVTLNAHVGDSLLLGYGRFRVIGVLRSVPGETGISAVIGPRVFIPARYVAETQLLVFGSRADYQALLRLPESVSPSRFVAPFRPLLERTRARARTVAETEVDLTSAIKRLSDFLGIVGLIALLLGGIGVASGVHAFVARKIDTVAILRCLGATSGQVLLIYLVQAGAMGLLGAAAGALLGLAIQFALPHAFGQFLPVDVTVQLEPRALATGLAVGIWVALLFAVRPLLGLRRISPLQALRRDVDDEALGVGRRDWLRFAVDAALVVSVVLVAIARTGSARRGLQLSAGIAGVIALLALSAAGLSLAARRSLRAGWPYVIRQGVANLYRPANQTLAVVLALGFGAFLISTLFLVQTNLLRQFDTGASESHSNLLFFDVQEDQAPGVDSLIGAAGYVVAQRTPIVTMRIAAINGAEADSLGRGGVKRAGWALRREYRSTYRDSLVRSERLVSGRWFRPASTRATGAPDEVSLEADVARELGVRLGDVITWDVQGVRVPTRVTSLREVNWARFEPNFFAVLDPASVDQAPKQFVLLSRVPEPEAVARLQRAVVDRYPNVSSVDLSLIQQTVANIVEKVSVAVRFMALFGLAMGIPVLFSAVAATRRERIREGVLLKTLGATRAQIGRIMLAEYALLGALGSLTGMLLSFAGAWWVVRYVFESDFAPALGPALAIALATMALTVSIGLLTGRDVFAETPMVALREV